MSVPTAQHHHRSTTKSSNKPYKSRHASKSALRERAKGRVERLELGIRRTPHQHIMSKLDRRNHAKQIRTLKVADRKQEKGIFEGRDGAPRIIALIPLCSDVNATSLLRRVNESVDVHAEPGKSPWRVDIPRFKQRLQYITPGRDIFECLDACRIADYVVFILSATEEVDEFGDQLLRCIESQGVSTVLVGVHNLSAIEPAKRRPDVLKSLKSFVTHFFAAQEKVHDLSSRQDCSNVLRSLCATIPKGVKWREDRSWLVVEKLVWEDDKPSVIGVVRGRALKSDRLVQVGQWGDLQVEKITAAPWNERLRTLDGDSMTIDESNGYSIIDEPSADQDDLAELAPEGAVMTDGAAVSLAPSERRAVLLDDHHYFDEDFQDEEIASRKRLPRGTSKYQAAWYLGNVSDSGSDLESVSDEEEVEDEDSIAAGPADGHFEDQAMDQATEAGAPSEYPQSEGFDDRAPEDEAADIEAYRKMKRDEAEEDLEFPDEIELHPHVKASERLAKYRGLKSLRTSTWDTEEDRPFEPEAWGRLLEIADYKSAKNKVLKDTLLDGVRPGTRVQIHLRVSPGQLVELQELPSPNVVFSLLRHEHKHTAVNCSITLSSDYTGPLKSKEQLYMQCGPRRLAINPLFSQAGNTPNNVHKFERFIHPGRTAVASFIGPVVWGSVPCLYFKQRAPTSDAIEDLADAISGNPQGQLEFIGTGTMLPPSTSRVTAKRVILTGHPFKIHKKLVTVRYMFFNAEDVQYFKALQLWTRRGRSGYIKETLGTHGYFKATFDGRINSMDAVAISLYKRVWPRQATLWRPQMDQVPALVDTREDADAMEI